MFPYKNPALSPEERAKDLLSRMTLREKVGQMQLVCKINRNFDGEEFDKTYPNGLGATYDTIELNPEEINRMQKHMVENTRLGIPIFMMSESLHGFICNGATVFPQSIGLGASFDRKLVEEVAKAAGSDARSMGVFETYAPNLDLSKDPRWGRVEENYGEDPYLTSRLGVAYVKGLQSNGIAACPKHYVAHGTPEAGLNKAPVHAGERELRETMLKPFAAAFMEGGAMSVMPAYSELDGVPVHSSRFLMTDILRGELGFEGWSVSDWSALILLVDTHFVAKDGLDAGKQALHAGIDMDAHTQFAYNDKFIEAAERGEVSMEEIDLATYRILLGKFRLGLFENPYADEDALKKLNSEKTRALAQKAAEEACVLLKNDGILPLDANAKQKIALIGPGGALTQLGDYTSPSATDRAVTILDAMKKRVGDQVVYEKGSCLSFAEDEMIEKAVAVANDSDIVVLVVTDNSSFYNAYWGDDNGKYRAVVTCGEGFDTHTLKFPGRQQDLYEAIAATDKPLIMLNMTGRPYELVDADKRANAIMQVWYPGQEGGEAIARLLFGEANPSGKTPISFPRSVGHIPCYYNHKPSAGGVHQKGSYNEPAWSYVFDTPGALYSFGHGLSYTKFEYSDLSVKQMGDMQFEATVTVKNVGDRAGDEVVMMFIRDVVCRITPFVKQLRGFERISLEPGEAKTLTFPIGFDDLSFINERMKPEVEPGEFRVMIGDQSAVFEVK